MHRVAAPLMRCQEVLMKNFGIPVAVAAIVLGTAFLPAQPVQAKSIAEMAESALNAVRRQSTPYPEYAFPYGYVQPQQQTFLGRLSDRYLDNRATFDPYTAQFGYNAQYPNAQYGYPQFQQNGQSLGSRLKDAVRGQAIRNIVNRIF